MLFSVLLSMSQLGGQLPDIIFVHGIPRPQEKSLYAVMSKSFRKEMHCLACSADQTNTAVTRSWRRAGRSVAKNGDETLGAKNA